MPKLDSRIYGADPTSCAERVAADALDTDSQGYSSDATVWGGDVEQKKSVGNRPDPGEAKAISEGEGKDSRAVTQNNRTRQG